MAKGSKRATASIAEASPKDAARRLHRLERELRAARDEAEKRVRQLEQAHERIAALSSRIAATTSTEASGPGDAEGPGGTDGTEARSEG
jgi:predicted  nucleic acid-binding Zn-ribbon protein